MDDLRAVAHGHAVSALGYEVKVDRESLVWKDGKHSVSWKVKKGKDGKLAVLKASREIARHKHDAEGAGGDLGERELGIIEKTVEAAMKVLRTPFNWV